jgi:hypothetical protein
MPNNLTPLHAEQDGLQRHHGQSPSGPPGGGGAHANELDRLPGAENLRRREFDGGKTAGLSQFERLAVVFGRPGDVGDGQAGYPRRAPLM